MKPVRMRKIRKNKTIIFLQMKRCSFGTGAPTPASRWNTILFLLLLSPVILFAQAPTSVMVHLNKSFYVNGETIWYQLYLPTTMRDTKATLKAVVLDGDGTVQGYYYLQTEGKTTVDGYYKLPYDAPAGMYRLLVWGRPLNRLQEAIFAAVPVPVYNDLVGVPDDATIFDPAALAQPQLPPGLTEDDQLKVSIAPAMPRPGEEISLQVQVLDSNGLPVRGAEVSVAVTDQQLCGSDVLPALSVQRGYPVPQARWENGLFLRGKITPQDTTSPENLMVGGFLPPAQRIFYSRVDEAGNFVLQFPAFYEPARLQFVSYPERDFTISLANALRTPAPPPLLYTEGIREYIDWSRLRKTLYQLYTTVEEPLRPEVPEDDFTLPEADRRVIPDQYQDFPDVATFLTEVVTPLRFNLDPETERYQAKMLNTEQREFFPGTPLFIVDQQLTRDADYVARLLPADIASIDLYYVGEKLFNQFLFLARNGLVVIRTKKGLTQLPGAEGGSLLQGVQAPAIFTLPQGKDVPNVRTALHWAGGLRTDDRGEVATTYRQSADRSTFQVEVVVQTPSGKRVRHTQTYTVPIDE